MCRRAELGPSQNVNFSQKGPLSLFMDESWKNKSTPYSTVLRNIVRQNKPTKVHMNRDLLPEVPEIVIIRYNIHVC